MKPFKSQPQPAFRDAHSSRCTVDPCNCLAPEFAWLPDGSYDLDEDDERRAIVFGHSDAWGFIVTDRWHAHAPSIVGFGLPSIGEAVKGALDALDQIELEGGGAMNALHGHSGVARRPCASLARHGPRFHRQTEKRTLRPGGRVGENGFLRGTVE